MFFPGVRRRAVHLPHGLLTFGLALFAISCTLIGWALFAPGAGNEGIHAPTIDVTTIKSIAYTIPGETSDDLVVQSAAPGRAPQVIASFPSDPLTRSHARGAAAPQGDRVAVVWLPALATSSNARLSLVNIDTRERVDVPGAFSYLGAIAWAPTGTRLALTGTVESEAGAAPSVVEVDVASQIARPVATFPGAFEVVPVGYSLDGARLYTVVVDQQGSNLYVERDGQTELAAEISPGRTAYWSLSPDGSRLAFVDILGSGSRTYVGRTLTIANGAISTLPAERNQFGATWMPGSPLPSFGGPGGAWQLTDPAAEDGYIVPDAWSPDGALLVATVYSPGDDESSRPSTAIEIITPKTTTSPSSRIRVSEASGASFLGWVKNLN